MIRICGPRDDPDDCINTTSRSTNWGRGLSPFLLGPVDLYNGYTSQNVENSWQYTKVYAGHGDKRGPFPSYWEWAKAGWGKSRADRYPMGKGVTPLYSYWDGSRLSYTEARRVIYCPLYSKVVEATPAYKRLEQLYAEKGRLMLWDFDSYDHWGLGMDYLDVLLCEKRKMGHAFVLAMMLDNQKVWED